MSGVCHFKGRRTHVPVKKAGKFRFNPNEVSCDPSGFLFHEQPYNGSMEKCASGMQPNLLEDRFMNFVTVIGLAVANLCALAHRRSAYSKDENDDRDI